MKRVLTAVAMGTLLLGVTSCGGDIDENEVPSDSPNWYTTQTPSGVQVECNYQGWCREVTP